MARKLSILKCLILCCIVYALGVTFMMGFYSMSAVNINSCPCPETIINQYVNSRSHLADQSATVPRADNVSKGDNTSLDLHKLAVIVPFRDRIEELVQFVPYVHSYFNKKKVRHKIYVINQIDNFRFNRAYLINVGFQLSHNECDYIAMHDVDLLPLNVNLSYSYPDKGPFHVSAPGLHPVYNYPTFIGGILLINNKHFEMINGMSNRYWGWGREDDELHVRLKKAGLKVSQPKNITTGKQTFKHVHNTRNRPRDNKRYFEQSSKTNRMDRETGLKTAKYDMISANSIVIDGAPAEFISVKLYCDVQKTPWCLKPQDHHLVNNKTMVVPKPLPQGKEPPKKV
ncbi:hypothetical protein ACJMK2_005907 [Sinanodonta woodiana]|uniref:Beta-1,4-galactosyltransferase n=1 Tax=Sinanodonta woodiana TaxID=1069815 RepID=A0ABD3VUN7_SINWO